MKECKGNPAAERDARESLVPFYKISKETGIPVGPLLTAEGLLVRFAKEGLSSVQQRLVIAEAIWTAYQRGHNQGRDYQRRIAKKSGKGDAHA